MGRIDLMPSAISLERNFNCGLRGGGGGTGRPLKAYDLFKQNILHYKRVQPTAADHANEQRSTAWHGTARCGVKRSSRKSNNKAMAGA